MEFVKSLNLLSFKPVIYAANVSEEEAVAETDNEYVTAVRQYAAAEGSDVIVICAKLESEIAERGRRKGSILEDWYN